MSTSAGRVARLVRWSALGLLGLAWQAWAQTATTPPGAGTAGSPYLISTLAHLLWVSQNVASSTGKHYRLQNDINAADTANWDGTMGFPPIGYWVGDEEDGYRTSFEGVFDGNGKVVRNLVIGRLATDYHPKWDSIGLFGHIGEDGVVQDLGVVAGSIEGFDAVGALAGDNDGTVTGCYATGSVFGHKDVGGLVGGNSGTLSDCYATGPVGGEWSVGGLAGWNSGAVYQCHATGDVRVFLGVDHPRWQDDHTAGGLVGNNAAYDGRVGTVEESYATGNVDGHWTVGGLVGSNAGAVSKCYATGAVMGWGLIGGLVGENHTEGGEAPGEIADSYAAGAVLSDDDPGAWDPGDWWPDAGTQAGGLVGANYGTVARCYSVGAVTGTAEVGGLVGVDSGWGGDGTVTASYWNTQTSGQADSAGGAGRTTAQMRQQSTYVGWDFGDVWSIDEGTSYPLLEQRVSSPAFSPTDGTTFLDTLTVTLSCATPGATIRYTLNGSEPKTSSTVYTMPLNLAATTTVKAKAFKTGIDPSNTATATYTKVTATPVCSPPSGTVFTGSLNLTLTCATAGATIRYTLNGSEPTASSPAYGGPLALTATTTVKAKAFKSGVSPSATVTAEYVQEPVATPVIGPPAGGLFSDAATVTIACVTPGVTIRYTLNGSDPTTASPIYSVPFELVTTTTVKARAFKAGYGPSATAVASFATVETPPGAGTADDPYRISHLGHLVWLSDTAGDSYGRFYELVHDLDASGTATWNDDGTDESVLEGFRPIGDWDVGFGGSFDGAGHVITGLTINRPEWEGVGLFGSVGWDGTVTALSLEGGSVGGHAAVGGLAGWNSGSLSQCSAAVGVTGAGDSPWDIGGLAGVNEGDIIRCGALGAVTATAFSSDTGGIGGLVGYNSGTLSLCYASGPVTATAADDVWESGGLVGFNEGSIAQCYAAGAVTTTAGDEVGQSGGLVGYNTGTAEQCFAVGPVVPTAGSWPSDIGGLVGYNEWGDIYSYWDTTTTGQGDSAGGNGLATAQMKQQASFVGWNFTSTWGIVANTSYPYLQWSPPPFRLWTAVQGPGSVALTPAGGTYAAGTLVTARAVPPADGSGEFIGWIGVAGDSAAMETTVLMDGHRSLVAAFRPVHLISSVTELQRLGNDPAYPLDGDYRLRWDIDASATAGWSDEGRDGGLPEGFRPIGTEEFPFQGRFDGAGHVIQGLTINRPDTEWVGLFAFLGEAASVSDLGLEGGSVTGYGRVGRLAGANRGTVSGCHVGGAVNGVQYVGGLLGVNSGTVTGCSASAAVTGASDDWMESVGGLVGVNEGTVVLSSATGTVTGEAGSGAGNIGGLIGSSTGPVSQCYATGTVTCEAGEDVGNTGGLIGYSTGPVSQCYATGAVTAESNSWVSNSGGLLGGHSSGTLSQCYATGAVTVTAGDEVACLGGLVGYNANGWIEQCYATGAVLASTGGDLWGLGGLVGDGDAGDVGDSYWDTTTTGQPDSAGGDGLTTAQMKQQASFAGWDFASTWGIAANASYPYLRWSPPPFGLSVTVSGPAGSVTLTPAGGTYAAGTLVTVRAVAPLGGAVEFARWLGGVADPAAAQTTVLMDGHRSLVAVFRAARGIGSIEELQRIGNDPDYPLDGHYWLTQDIDASATASWNDVGTDESLLEGFLPIGSAGEPFTGQFDGAGHVIYGLTIRRAETDWVGLFGVLGAGASVTDLGLEANQVRGDWDAGGLVGQNLGTLSRCYSVGRVGGGNGGGLVAWNSGAIRQCYASGVVVGDGGGLVGYNDGLIAESYSTSALVGGGSGGLVAGNEGTVEFSYWDVEASGLADSAGGEGLTTAEMQQQASFAGWDFASTWGIVEGTSYPYLRWSPPPFRLWVVAQGPGTVTVEPLQAGYAAGTLVTVRAAPAEGGLVEFVGWLGGVADPAALETTATMAGHRFVVAVFRTVRGIGSIEELQKIGYDPAYTLDGRYWLTQDIDATATVDWNDAGTDETLLEGFRPIGTTGAPFTGSLDGAGHLIAGLAIDRPSADGVGLFGVAGVGAEFASIGLVGGAVDGDSYVGGLLGRTDGATVSQCYVDGAVAGSYMVGGLVGRSDSGTVDACSATGTVTGGSYVGGLIGFAGSPGTVSACWAAATVAGGYDVGGLAGVNWGTLTNCYAGGPVSGNQALGGLVGYSAAGDITRCYATGAVTGGSYVGGLLGYDGGGGTISGCYAAGAVTGSSYRGGLIGKLYSSTVISCYWDTQTSGQATSAGGTGRTTAQMLRQATYVDWDFVEVWRLSPSRNGGYPYLYGVTKEPATVALSDLTHTYDGTATGATVTTDPPGLAVTVTYNGAATCPVDAGTYFVWANVTDPEWRGAATGVLEIARAMPLVDWSPAALEHGQALGPAQLNATASVPGSFVYEPAAGTVLTPPGEYTLQATFAPTDGTNWATVTAQAVVEVVDTLPPACLEKSPESGAVGPDEPLQLVFSEPVFAGAGLIVIRRLADGSVFESIAVGAKGSVTVNGAGVTIGHGRLVVGESYGIEVDGTAFVDIMGRPFAGIGAGEWTLTATEWQVCFVAGPHGRLSGQTTQYVGQAGASTPVTAVGDYGFVLDRWNDGLPDNPRTVSDVRGDLTLTASFRPADGFMAAAVTDVVNRAWWDVTGVYEAWLDTDRLDLTLVHDAAGKITGTAQYTASAKNGIAGEPVILSVKGSARGAGGALVAKLAMAGTDAAKTTRVRLSVALTLDAAARQLTGPVSGRVRTAAGRDPVTGQLTLHLPLDMDGTWALVFGNLVEGARGKVAGTAVLALSNGTSHVCAVKGKERGDGYVLGMTGSAADPAAKGIVIRGTVSPQADGWADLGTCQGRGYGQKVGW